MVSSPEISATREQAAGGGTIRSVEKIVDILELLSRESSGMALGDLASRLGMTPESLSRAFAQLKDAGVSGRGRHIAIADVSRLRDHCRFEDGA